MKPIIVKEIKEEQTQGTLASHWDFHKSAYQSIYLISAVNIVLGAIKLANPTGMLDACIGLGYGILFLLLGIIVHKKKSIPALITAIVVYGMDAILVIVAVLLGWSKPTGAVIGGYAMRIVLFCIMIKGVKAIKMMKIISPST